MSSQDGEPALAEVQGEYPGWRCWRAASGMYHARRIDAAPGDPADETFVTGEDPLDLRDQIHRAQALANW